MKTFISFVWVTCVVVVVVVVGCEEKKAGTQRPASANSDVSVGAKATEVNRDWQPTHPEPEYTLAIEKSETDPPTYAVVWSAKVDSGGWRMTTESVLVEESNRSIQARVYVVLHEPPPGEAVTVAPEVLTDRHENKTEIVHLAELSAKHTVKDSNPTYPQLFAVVKTAGEPSGE